MSLSEVKEDGTMTVKPNVELLGEHTLTLNGKKFTYTVEPGLPKVDYSYGYLSSHKSKAGETFHFKIEMKDRLGYDVLKITDE
jgi:hypothetical protein